ncbi:protein of unknown function [Micropruina glycogenica]|uniref:Uncharacterized protein n=1 Tax=Micropruina glycogenica TaxID=75385 RepID=A0A2N9JCP4_9ACTN|nr:protein of unknown function [Micropruina glycogenica]
MRRDDVVRRLTQLQSSKVGQEQPSLKATDATMRGPTPARPKEAPSGAGPPLSGRGRAFAHSEALAEQFRKGGSGAAPLRGTDATTGVSTSSTNARLDQRQARPAIRQKSAANCASSRAR